MNKFVNNKILCFFIVFVASIINCNKSSSSWNKNIFRGNTTTGQLSSVKWMWREQEMSENNASECIKNVDRKYHGGSETATKQLTNLMFTLAPPLDLSQTEKVTQICRQQSQIYIKELKVFQMWALKLYDSTAKMPTGILNGNINQFGDFDMCINANSKDFNISGKYCLASLQIEINPFTRSPISLLHKLSHSHYHFRSSLEDPEHRVPQFSSTKWGVCVPSGCSAQDVEIGLKDRLDNLLKNVDLQISVRINSEMCQTKREPLQGSNSNATTIARWVFVGFIVLALFATFYDYYAMGSKNQILMAFSLRKNTKALLNIKRSSDDIEAIHGIRFLNAILLLLAHKSMALFFLPYANRTEMIELLAQSWTVLARAASLYTDPFIMISGTLTAYSLFGKLARTNKINIVEEYVSRLLRIAPTFAALIAFCTFILPSLSSGPMWNLVVTHHSNICKRNWWRNLLFIHNYYGLEDMCLTHTHHIGIDTELFFISPILVLLLWKWPKKGTIALIGLGLLSTIMRYYVTYTMQLSNYVHFGTSIKQLFATADNMYILPAHRLTVYIMGIFLGYVLRKHRNTELTNAQIRVGNAAALLSFGISFWGNAFMGNINYQYHESDAAWYAAFSPILWCFTFAWIIFTTHCGHRGFIEKIFSAPVFSYWTKISYTVYLTQFPIFFYNVGVVRTTQRYDFFTKMFDFNEFALIIIASVMLNLLFEAPFQNIRNVLFSNSNKSKCIDDCSSSNNNNRKKDIKIN